MQLLDDLDLMKVQEGQRPRWAPLKHPLGKPLETRAKKVLQSVVRRIRDMDCERRFVPGKMPLLDRLKWNFPGSRSWKRTTAPVS